MHLSERIAGKFMAYQGKFSVAYGIAFLAGLFLNAPQSFAQVKPSVYDAWVVRCEGGGHMRKSSSQKCEVFQRLVGSENGRRIMEIAISFVAVAPSKNEGIAGVKVAPESVSASNARQARAVIVTPLGIDLRKGVNFNVDKNFRHAMNVRYCVEEGCFAYLTLPRNKLEQMSSGFEGQVTFTMMDGQEISLPVSMKGLTAALQAIH
jgi:invasion protein IalB